MSWFKTSLKMNTTTQLFSSNLKTNRIFLCLRQITTWDGGKKKERGKQTSQRINMNNLGRLIARCSHPKMTWRRQLPREKEDCCWKERTRFKKNENQDLGRSTEPMQKKMKIKQGLQIQTKGRSKMTKKHDHEYCKVTSSYSIYTTKEFSLFMSDGILNGKVIQQQREERQQCGERFHRSSCSR